MVSPAGISHFSPKKDSGNNSIQISEMFRDRQQNRVENRKVSRKKQQEKDGHLPGGMIKIS